MPRLSKLALGFLTVIAFTAGTIKAGLWYRYFSERRDGRQLAAQIRKFETERGNLPESVEEMGLRSRVNELGPFYQKNDDQSFSIWYPEGLDGCYALSSKTNKWQFSCSI